LRIPCSGRSANHTGGPIAKPFVKLFRNDREARFLERPNRFLIIAEDEITGEGKIPCHCPNPGRLIEFFGYRGSDIPGATLILEKREAGTKAKTHWTAAGLYYRDAVVPLFSARANGAAEKLILPAIIPGIRSIQGEFTVENSRFDFLCVDHRGTRHLVEVKACSLVEHGIAMFPDAPSERALKHLEELAALSSQPRQSRGGYVCHLIFVIVHGEPDRFIPNLHTDPDFAGALGIYGRAVDPTPTKQTPGENQGGPVLIHACLLRCDSTGTAYLARPRIPVDLDPLAVLDSGSYLVLLEIPQAGSIGIGALGTLYFEAGWYLYAGSARKNLSKRIARHLRRVRKKQHWHIDYLGPHAAQIRAYPICSYRNLECELARALENLGGRGIPGFGSSDCRCKSHLFYFPDPPLRNPAFIELLLRCRHVAAYEK
jgi:sugar fermentation stimulation protein A